MNRYTTLILLSLLPSCATSTVVERGTTSSSSLPNSTPLELGEWKDSRASVLRTFAFRALERGLLEEAQGYLQEACELNAEDSACHAAMARLLLASDNPQAALPYARQALDAEPDSVEALLVWSAALAENKREDEAGKALEAGLEMHSQSPEYARAMVTHYSSSDSGEAANKYVEHMLATRPESASSWSIAGDLYLAGGQINAAATAYGEALRLNPDTSAPSVLRSRLGLSNAGIDPILSAATQAEKKGDWAGAERLYRFLAESKENDHEVLSGLARILSERKSYIQSAKILERIPEAELDWRDRLLQAKLDIRLSRWEAAQASLLIILHERPGLRAAELLLQHVQQKIAQRNVK